MSRHTNGSRLAVGSKIGDFRFDDILNHPRDRNLFSSSMKICSFDANSFGLRFFKSS